MSKIFYITDKQWEIIKPNLPEPKITDRPSLNPHTVFNAISDAKWRYLSKEYGVFESILQALINSCVNYSLI